MTKTGKLTKKLSLGRETLRALKDTALTGVGGGYGGTHKICLNTDTCLARGCG